VGARVDRSTQASSVHPMVSKGHRVRLGQKVQVLTSLHANILPQLGQVALSTRADHLWGQHLCGSLILLRAVVMRHQKLDHRLVTCTGRQREEGIVVGREQEIQEVNDLAFLQERGA